MEATIKMDKQFLIGETVRTIFIIIGTAFAGIIVFMFKGWISSTKEANLQKKAAQTLLQTTVTALVSETRELRGDMQGIRAEMHNSANSLNIKIDEKISGVTVQLEEIHKELKTDIIDMRQRINLLEDIKRA